MTDREDDFDRTAKDSEGRKVQQELESQLRELEIGRASCRERV